MCRLCGGKHLLDVLGMRECPKIVAWKADREAREGPERSMTAPSDRAARREIIAQKIRARQAEREASQRGARAYGKLGGEGKAASVAAAAAGRCRHCELDVPKHPTQPGFHLKDGQQRL